MPSDASVSGVTRLMSDFWTLITSPQSESNPHGVCGAKLEHGVMCSGESNRFPIFRFFVSDVIDSRLGRSTICERVQNRLRLTGKPPEARTVP
jgi:hypothetical protein